MARVSAGSFDLNKWLYGGYERGVITTLYGDAGSGKTNFCLLAAVSQARKGKKVIFVDTEGGFSSERVKQIIQYGKNGKDSEISYEDVLKNILLLKPTNFEEQKKDFDRLEKYLKEHINLIVVDGMTMLYRLEFAGAREKANGEDISGLQKVNSELTRQMRLLAEIARKKDIPVLVSNQTYKWSNEVRMVGGDIMKYWSKCLIELENESGRRTAFLRKHRSLKEGRLPIQIWDGGVKKRGWI